MGSNPMMNVLGITEDQLRTPGWNGYGVTLDDKPKAAPSKGGGSAKPILNAFQAAFKFGAPEAYEQGRQRKLQGQLANAFKQNDLGTASNLLFDMGQIDNGLKVRDMQASVASDAKTQQLQGMQAFIGNLKSIPEAQRAQYLESNWNELAPLVGNVDFMTYWQQSGGDVSDASLMEDEALIRTQLGEAPAPAEAYTLAPGAIRFGGDNQVVASNPKPQGGNLQYGTGLHEVIGPDGNPMFVRTDNQGGLHPVQDYTPVPDAADSNSDRVQSTFVDQDGNLNLVMRDGTIRPSGMGVQNPFQITDVGGVPTAINRRTGEGMAISTPEEVGTNKATTETIVANEADRREAQKDLPVTLQNAEQSISTIKQAIEHPAFGARYGFASIAGIRPPVPGTPEAEVQGMLNQIGGQAFLEAFESLKGGGHITEIEGDKATAARTRMLYQAQSPEAARRAALEFIGYIETGMERARAQAQGAYAPQGANSKPLVYNPETGDFE